MHVCASFGGYSLTCMDVRPFETELTYASPFQLSPVKPSYSRRASIYN